MQVCFIAKELESRRSNGGDGKLAERMGTPVVIDRLSLVYLVDLFSQCRDPCPAKISSRPEADD